MTPLSGPARRQLEREAAAVRQRRDELAAAIAQGEDELELLRERHGAVLVRRDAAGRRGWAGLQGGAMVDYRAIHSGPPSVARYDDTGRAGQLVRDALQEQEACKREEGPLLVAMNALEARLALLRRGQEARAGQLAALEAQLEPPGFALHGQPSAPAPSPPQQAGPSPTALRGALQAAGVELQPGPAPSPLRQRLDALAARFGLNDPEDSP